MEETQMEHLGKEIEVKKKKKKKTNYNLWILWSLSGLFFQI